MKFVSTLAILILALFAQSAIAQRPQDSNQLFIATTCFYKEKSLYCDTFSKDSVKYCNYYINDEYFNCMMDNCYNLSLDECRSSNKCTLMGYQQYHFEQWQKCKQETAGKHRNLRI